MSSYKIKAMYLKKTRKTYNLERRNYNKYELWSISQEVVCILHSRGVSSDYTVVEGNM
jgi:hypothetical protein